MRAVQNQALLIISNNLYREMIILVYDVGYCYQVMYRYFDNVFDNVISCSIMNI